MTRNSYPHMVLDDYVYKVRQIHRERQARLDQIATRQQAEAYQREIREAIRRAFSPLPPKTPLNARVTGAEGGLRGTCSDEPGIVDQPGYCGEHVRIEKVIFESRPGCLVTANLYIPRDIREPAPCVLGACGHTENGKAGDLYQGFCQRLAHAGFVVLIYDPFSQGERDQYYRLDDRDMVGWSTRAHNMMSSLACGARGMAFARSIIC